MKQKHVRILRYLIQQLPSKIRRVQKDLPKLKIVLTMQVEKIKEETTWKLTNYKSSVSGRKLILSVQEHSSNSSHLKFCTPNKLSLERRKKKGENIYKHTSYYKNYIEEHLQLNESSSTLKTNKHDTVKFPFFIGQWFQDKKMFCLRVKIFSPK